LKGKRMHPYGAIINVIGNDNPNIKSLLNEGLWGFPDDKRGINKTRWNNLEVGTLVLLYGDFFQTKGVWFLCEFIDKFENREPVKYWIKNPLGYPWQIKLKPKLPYNFSLQDLREISPIGREALAFSFGINIFKPKVSLGWSIILFGAPNVSYSYSAFERIVDEFNFRNAKIRP
jgi:hypothetical protein